MKVLLRHGKERSWAWKDAFIKASRKFDFPVHKPIIDLTKKEYQILWKGNEFANGINDFFKEVEQNYIKCNTVYCCPGTAEERFALIVVAIVCARKRCM